MKALFDRTPEMGVKHHEQDPVRIYVDDYFQAPRIKNSVAMANEALASLGLGRRQVVELGCGTGDISGQLSKDHDVLGLDCNPASIAEANRRWATEFRAPHYSVRNITQPLDMAVVSVGGDLLIICEILEHLAYPGELVTKYLPLYKTCVISHPINGDLQGDLSGGDHQWSYSWEDFVNWFTLGGHEIVQSCRFDTGGYNIGLAWGKRCPE